MLFYIEDGETRSPFSASTSEAPRCCRRALRRSGQESRPDLAHTGSGKTFTLLTAAQLILSQKIDSESHGHSRRRSHGARGPAQGMVDKLLGEMQANDIPVRRANSKDDLQDIFESDFRGLVVSMIHKFETIRRTAPTATGQHLRLHRRGAPLGCSDLGSYLMAAVPNSTIIGFHGTPVRAQEVALGLVPIFGSQDENGYLHKYSIIESIDDETTLTDQYLLAPSSIVDGA
ncbi:hypothetical protein GS563_14095 [Rhodococcus hoagii]|nr:hypothetical protein [Prescottella equi]